MRQLGEGLLVFSQEPGTKPQDLLLVACFSSKLPHRGHASVMRIRGMHLPGQALVKKLEQPDIFDGTGEKPDE